jgi:hypothetical protein
MENLSKVNMEEILGKLNKIELDIEYLKKHVKDEDIFLSKEEEKLLEESYENEKNGKLKSHEDLEKELGL